MKFITIFAAFILCLCMICSFIPSQSDMQIYTDTVRLHVIAESDDSADQLIKLSVRNEVVEYLSELSENAQSAEETIKIINDNIDDIRRVADRALEKLDSDAKAEVVSSFLWKSLCKRVKEKAFRAFTQKALSRAIQFAIIQRNYYITRKRRGQGALFGRVLVICQRLSGMSPPIPPPECRIRIPPYR